MTATKRLSRWKLWICSWCCPRWQEDRPGTDEPGPWVAVALRVSNRGPREVEWLDVNAGLGVAYEHARWLALKLDWSTHSELGVSWAVRRPEGRVTPRRK